MGICPTRSWGSGGCDGTWWIRNDEKSKLMWRRDFVGLRILMIEFMVADWLLINNIDKQIWFEVGSLGIW